MSSLKRPLLLSRSSFNASYNNRLVASSLCCDMTKKQYFNNEPATFPGNDTETLSILRTIYDLKDNHPVWHQNESKTRPSPSAEATASNSTAQDRNSRASWHMATRSIPSESANTIVQAEGFSCAQTSTTRRLP